MSLSCPVPSWIRGCDLRSRYSIPSRILDYMAVELPIVGTVHEASATGGFVRKLGLDPAATCSGPEEIADWLVRLSRPERWAEQSAKSRNAFDLLQRQEVTCAKAQTGPGQDRLRSLA